MGATTTPTADEAKALVDAIINQQQVLAAAQAKQASLMLEFSDTRRRLDHQRITTLHRDGADPRYTAGEFAALEIGLAIKANKHGVSRTIGIARRLKEETPDAFDAWQVGHIDHPRAARINKALIRLTQDSSKQLLNVLVVDVAVCKTVELLGRWLNEFIARVEPDQTNDRLRRSLDDRYVSIRPDIDGISFLTAAIASADADAINQVLDALAATAEPGDTRTFQQRRADACTELLLGKISNGCHVTWRNDPDNDEDQDIDESDDSESDDSESDDSESDEDRGANDVEHTDKDLHDTADRPSDTDNDWDLPASAFRPDPQASPPDPDPTDETGTSNSPPNPYRKGRPVITPCPNDHQARPIPATIGVIITAQSLFGYSNTPGQLTDRSSLVPADLIRDLAQQPGTLFHRLLTDEKGNLLDVTELGRFPSRKLGMAINYRDGACTTPICTTPAHKCDHDHVIPVPDGPTTAQNLNNDCRPEHRAKTHAGHHTSRDGNVTTWTTPTGHTYTTTDQPFPAEQWPIDEKEPPQ